MPQKSMPLPRFEPGSPRPCPKSFPNLDRTAMGPLSILLVLRNVRFNYFRLAESQIFETVFIAVTVYYLGSAKLIGSTLAFG